tara:strand:- start:6298 stop:7248 length:951 start_codon:yes stop_codon:yes gene_type:complete
MKEYIFSSLVSITSGIHRDSRPESDFQILLSEFEKHQKASNAVFEIKFKRPLTHKKEYYRNLISNETEKSISSFIEAFPKNATLHENKYSYVILNNKCDKYLHDIVKYIHKREITSNLNEDINYIITYLKVSIIRLYAELQEQYGHFSENHFYTIPEIAEKYFNDTSFDLELIEKIQESQKVIIEKTSKPKSKLKTSFGFKNRDTSKLLKVLNNLQYNVDLLQNRTTVEELHKLLIAKDFTLINSPIYIQCETTQFSYIVSKLKPFFNSFTPTSIERSGNFITKTGTTLKANNLHKNKVHNPKEKEEIDNIINQLQ